jgi:hypothetical protein
MDLTCISIVLTSQTFINHCCLKQIRGLLATITMSLGVLASLSFLFRTLKIMHLHESRCRITNIYNFVHYSSILANVWNQYSRYTINGKLLSWDIKHIVCHNSIFYL